MSTHTPDHSEDLALVQRIMDGDESASEELVRKYSYQLENYAHKQRVLTDDCQDVLQDTFMAAVSQIQRGKFRGESSLRTWLHSILRRRIADHFRRNPDRPMIQLDNIEIPADQLKLIGDDRDQLITHLEVSKAARKLSTRARVILLMKFTEGMTIDELSQWMDVSIGQAYRELQKARNLFRQYILNEKPTDKKGR